MAPEEPGAANVLRVAGLVKAHPGFPHTLERIAALGYAVRRLDVSEFLKAEAALTCKSLLITPSSLRSAGRAPVGTRLYCS